MDSENISGGQLTMATKLNYGIGAIGKSLSNGLSGRFPFPLLTEPDITVLLPMDLDIRSALSLPGAKPPAMVNWVLSTMTAAPSRW